MGAEDLIVVDSSGMAADGVAEFAAGGDVGAGEEVLLAGAPGLGRSINTKGACLLGGVLVVETGWGVVEPGGVVICADEDVADGTAVCAGA